MSIVAFFWYITISNWVSAYGSILFASQSRPAPRGCLQIGPFGRSSYRTAPYYYQLEGGRRFDGRKRPFRLFTARTLDVQFAHTLCINSRGFASAHPMRVNFANAWVMIEADIPQ